MTHPSSSQAARREFLRRTGRLGMAGMASPWALSLAAMGNAAAAGASDYKAMVCVFLAGGNDQGNMLVPYDNANHARYASVRTGISIARDTLTATVLSPATPLGDGLQLALAPPMTRLKKLFDAGQAAVQLNVGPLVVPTTLAQIKAQSVPLPARLFSHNDQQSTWQSSSPEGSVTGWGGRMVDLLSAQSNSAFTCMSVTGNSLYLAGDTHTTCQLSASGPVPISSLFNPVYGSAATRAAVAALVTRDAGGTMEREYAKVVAQSIQNEQTLRTALASAAPLATPFDPANSLAAQLKMVARMIACREQLGVKRQVFMVTLGGFDTHDFLLANHPGLMAKVSDALGAFYDATVELGVASNVTAFTASDFGRTLVSNGDGSDHGWGSHHFVVGGAVRGGKFYGQAPSTDITTPQYLSGGVLLPTTSVDQYSATLARWFGVSSSDLALVAPSLPNFDVKNLGFV